MADLNYDTANRHPSLVTACARRPYGRVMSTNQPNTIGPTLEQLLEQVIFSDQATHPIREEWEQTKAEEQLIFERVCQEQYEQRLEYHRVCRTPNAEQEARCEANLLRPMLREELDARLAERWSIVLRKVQAVLADKSAASAETPDNESASRAGDNPGT
jgi:hypothetical protein